MILMEWLRGMFADHSFFGPVTLAIYSEKASGRRKEPLLLRLQVNNLTRVKDPRHLRCVGKPGAHDQTAFVHTFGVFRPEALTGGKHTMIKHTPLAAVSVAGQNEIHGGWYQGKVFTKVTGPKKEWSANIPRNHSIRIISPASPGFPRCCVPLGSGHRRAPARPAWPESDDSP